MIKNVEIIGFDYGINAQQRASGIVLEDITLSNQKINGIYNLRQVLAIRGLRSDNSVPVINNDLAAGLITLIDGYFTGGVGGNDAIIDTASVAPYPSPTNQNVRFGGGGIYLRSVTAIGYNSTLKLLQAPLAPQVFSYINDETISEYSSHGANSLFSSSPAKSMQLPIELTPVFHDLDMGNWINVTNPIYGAKSDDWIDDTVAIQDAIDDAVANGKSTVYLPVGRYIISDTIVVRGSIQRLIGFNVKIYPSGAAWADANNPKAVFRVENDTQAPDGIGETVFIEGISWEYNNINSKEATVIEHDSERSLVIRRSLLTGGDSHKFSYASGRQNVGSLYMENTIASSLRFNYPQNIWARQFNLEGYGSADERVLNNGARLWVLGSKTEALRSTQAATMYNSLGGAQTEVLGVLFMGRDNILDTMPTIASTDSNISFSYATSTPLAKSYPVHIKETRQSDTRELLRGNVPVRGYDGHSILPLYTGYTAATADPSQIILETFDSASHDGAVIRTGSSRLELSTEQSVSRGYSLKITDAPDTTYPVQPHVRWNFATQSDNTMVFSFNIYKETAGNSNFGVDINAGSTASNRAILRYSGNNIVMSHKTGGVYTTTVLAQGLPDKTWYKVKLEVPTTSTATVFSAIISSIDESQVYGSSNSIPFHNDTSGPISRIHFLDDGVDADVIYVDDINVQALGL